MVVAFVLKEVVKERERLLRFIKLRCQKVEQWLPAGRARGPYRTFHVSNGSQGVAGNQDGETSIGELGVRTGPGP